MTLKQRKQHEAYRDIAINIIESVIEPLHYPQKGVNGAKYYELEDAIIAILDTYAKDHKRITK